MKKLLSIIVSLVMILMLFPASIFAQDEENQSGVGIAIYQDVENITNQTIELPAAAFSLESTKTKLEAKDADGNVLNDVTWENENEDYLTVTEEGSKCTVATKPEGIGQNVKVTARLSSGESASINIKIMIHCKNWRYTKKSANVPNVGENSGTNLRLGPLTEDGKNTLVMGFEADTKLNEWYAKHMRCTESTNPNVIAANEVSFTTLSVTGRKPMNWLVFAVTPKTAGETVLTFELDTKEFGEYKQSFTVQTAEGIKGLTSAMVLAPGDEQTLNATVEPSTEVQTVIYASNNPSVAKVTKDGKITAVSTGNCIITARQDNGNYEWPISVKVIQEGIYQVDGGIENIHNVSAAWKPVGESLEIKNGDPVWLGYFSKDDPEGYRCETWQSSNTNVVDTNSRNIIPKGNGSADLRVMELSTNFVEDHYELQYEEKARLKVIVDVSGFKEAPEYVKDDYGPQGKSQTKLEVTGKNISTNTANGFIFENYINTLLDKKNTEFSFTVSSSSGDGGAKPDDYVQKWMLDHIKLYDKADMTKPIASFEKDGGLVLEKTEANESKNPTSVTFSVTPEVLDFDHEYALVFDEGFRLNHTIGRDAVFYFKTREFVKAQNITLNQNTANVAVNGKLELTASFEPKDADDTKLIWTSSDDSIATVYKDGTVIGIKAGTVVIKAENESGLTAQCKVTVDPVKVAATSIKAQARTYNTAGISWKKVEGADGYEVYGAASKTGTYKKIGETTSLNLTDKGLDTGKTKYYKVRSYTEVNGTRYRSAYSNIVSVKPVLNKVSGAKTKTAYNKVKLSYGEVAGASGYVVYKASKKSDTYKKLATVKGGKTLSFTDKKVKTGKTYYYKVKAYRNVKGEKIYGKASGIVSGKPVLSSSTLKLTVRKGQITAKWSKVAGADKYQLYRNSKKDGKYTLMSQTVKTTFTDKKIKAGKTYYYKLRAYKVVDGKKVYSKYTSVIKVKAK